MQEKAPLVSVIVPCYNVEKYLEQCLDSILAQTLKDIEIITLNDGSVDNTLKILEKYRGKDSRINVYTHDNMGLGMTRNRGISLAKGQYIAFVDSDDYIAPEMLMSMYKVAIEKNADIVEGETLMVYANGTTKLRKDFYNVEDICVNKKTKETFYKEYYFSHIYTHNACDKIYKKSMILDNDVRFGDNRRIFAEDNWFQLQVLRLNPKICFVNNICYMYRQHDNSIMHKKKNNLIARHGCMIKDYMSLLKENVVSQEEKKVCTLIAADALIMQTIEAMDFKMLFSDYMKTAKEVGKNEYLCKSIEGISKIKGYKLEPKREKRIVLYTISVFYRLKLYSLAHLLMWFIYLNRFTK